MQITKGRVFAQRFYDIADEVDLPLAEKLLKEQQRQPPEVRKARHLRIPHPPLDVVLQRRAPGIPDVPAAEVRLRVYDVGVLAITFEIALPSPLDADGLVRFAARVLESEGAITDAGRAIAREVAAAVVPASKDPKLSELAEDYTIFAIETTEPTVDAERFRQYLDLGRVLLGEVGALSAQERGEVTERWFSYDPNQLVVITWNSALVFGKDGLGDLLDLLEVTGMQLLELRHYDEEVRQSLDGLYDELERREVTLLSATRYRRLSRTILRLFVDVTEVTERVENSLQWLGDTWYARVHRAAVKAFDIPRWQQQLEHKLDLLQEINELIVDQITTRQNLRLEGAIVLLIVFEIVMAFFKVM
ncbi:MAG: hypothetical protein HY903_09370 [Deltaproteobacteria bacterium]|nr:hypothetical protein [Deltaproteobacteria bacterium]